MKIYTRKERTAGYFKAQALESALLTLILLVAVYTRSPYDWLSIFYTVGIVGGVINVMSSWPRMFRAYRGSREF